MRTPNILVVDDEPSLLKLMATALAKKSTRHVMPKRPWLSLKACGAASTLWSPIWSCPACLANSFGK